MVGLAVEYALESRTELGVLLSFELQDVCKPTRYQLRCACFFQGLFPGCSRHGAGDYAVPTRDCRCNSVRHIIQNFKWTAPTEFAVVSLSPKLDSASSLHKLRVDAKGASPFTNAAFNHIACA